MVVVSFIINLSLWLMWLTIWRTLGGYEFAPSLRASFVRSFRSSAFQFTRSQPPLVPHAGRFTSRVGGGSAFYVRPRYHHESAKDIFPVRGFRDSRGCAAPRRTRTVSGWLSRDERDWRSSVPGRAVAAWRVAFVYFSDAGIGECGVCVCFVPETRAG